MMAKPIKLALLVDDELIDQRMYERVIRRSELVEEVLCFDMAADALAFLKDNPDRVPDVIFLDINMPRMDGFQFLETASAELGETFTKMVVAMLTTSLNPKDRERAEGFDVVRQFINKPLTVDHIADVAKALAV